MSTPKRSNSRPSTKTDPVGYRRAYAADKKAGKTGTRRKITPLDPRPPRHKRRPSSQAPSVLAKKAAKKEARERGYQYPVEPAEEGFVLRMPVARCFVPLLAPRRYKGARGGRGSGKSHFFAERLITRCIQEPHTRAVCLREILASIKKSVKLLIEDKIRAHKLAARFDIQKTEIIVLDEEGNKCGLIAFQGMQDHTVDSIKSLEGFDIAWVEEAQSLSEHSFGLLRPTIRKEGSELWFSWNPRSKKDPVDKFFMDGIGDPDMECIDAQYFDNPWLPDTLKKEMLYDKQRDNDRYLHVWCGKYQTQSQSRVFKRWRIGTDADFDKAEVRKLMPRYGMDFGYSNDPTVVIKLRVDDVKRKIYICAEAYKIGCEIDQYVELMDSVDETMMRKYPVVADSSRPESISHIRKNGYPLIKGAKKGAGSVEEGVKFLQAYDIIIHENCVHTIDEFTMYSYVVDKHTEEVTNELADTDNHVIDAARYALESIRQSGRVGVLW